MNREPMVGDLVQKELTPAQVEANNKADQDPEFVALMDEFVKEQEAKYGNAATDQMNVNQFFARLPRKVRRKMMAKDSFSNQFKANMNKK